MSLLNSQSLKVGSVNYVLGELFEEYLLKNSSNLYTLNEEKNSYIIYSKLDKTILLGMVGLDENGNINYISKYWDSKVSGSDTKSLYNTMFMLLEKLLEDEDGMYLIDLESFEEPTVEVKGITISSTSENKKILINMYNENQFDLEEVIFTD